MDRKEKILLYIKSKDYIPLKFDELMVVLDVPEDERDTLSRILKELELEGRIVVTKRSRYAPCIDNSVFVGRLSCGKRGKFGFVICDDGGSDVYVDIKDMNSALHNDRVLVKIDNKSADGASCEGHIIRVLQRSTVNITGVIEKAAHDCFYVIPDDSRIFARLRINHQNMGNAANGDRVLAEITRYDDGGRLSGKVIKSLGRAETLSSCMEAIIIENSLKTEFDPETIEQALNTPEEVSDISGRLDIRNDVLFTIDGETARDFDDAVSLSMCEDGSYRLGVHIADVSHYVTGGSPLDSEALCRGTSVYLPDRVIPMLPERLSNGICSLNPGVDRLALSVFMVIDENGDVTSHSLRKTVIRSHMRMTYEKVNHILEEGSSQDDEEYSTFLPVLKQMQGLSEILRSKRIKRGAVNFDFPESEIITDINGKPVMVRQAERGVSNKMIEEFMLAANETVAEYAFWSEIPFVYRIHEAPSLEKIAAFQLFLKSFGLGLKGKIDKDNAVKPKALEQIMEAVSGRPEERVVAKTMLRSLMKAEYSHENSGHFGLAAKYYCHFTSPIRRYPDLVIHRILKEFIDGELTSEKTAFFDGYVREAARESSEREQSAELCERDADDLMKTAYMSDYVGEEFSGIISGVTKFGIFVELENSIEGLVRLENITDDYYTFYEEKIELSGERTGKTYKIGGQMDIIVARCDILSRQIDFIPAESLELLSKFVRPPKNRKTRRSQRRRS